MISKKILFISLVFSLLTVSCNKKGCTDSLALNYDEKAKKDDGSCEFLNQNTKPLFLQTHHFYDSLTFYLDSSYNDDFGTKIKFNRASFYLGKNGFYDENNISIDDTVNHMLIHPDENIYQIGHISNIDNIKSEFYIGVDSIRNHISPANYMSNNPLSYQTPSTHWQMGSNPINWSYLFIIIEGSADSNSNGIFETNENFIFHIGGDEYISNIYKINSSVIDNLQTNNLIGITPNSYSININLNWASIINSIDIKNSQSTHGGGNVQLAEKIVNNCDYLISEHF